MILKIRGWGETGDFQKCARDLLSRDRVETRDPCLRDRDETESLKFCPRRDGKETFKIRDEIETRRCSFQDAGRDLEVSETLESLGSFNVLPRHFLRRMVKHIDNEK